MSETKLRDAEGPLDRQEVVRAIESIARAKLDNYTMPDPLSLTVKDDGGFAGVQSPINTLVA